MSGEKLLVGEFSTGDGQELLVDHDGRLLLAEAVERDRPEVEFTGTFRRQCLGAIQCGEALRVVFRANQQRGNFAPWFHGIGAKFGCGEEFLRGLFALVLVSQGFGLLHLQVIGGGLDGCQLAELLLGVRLFRELLVNRDGLRGLVRLFVFGGEFQQLVPVIEIQRGGRG